MYRLNNIFLYRNKVEIRNNKNNKIKGAPNENQVLY